MTRSSFVVRRVEVIAAGMKQCRRIHSSHSHKNGGALKAHFGLGKQDKVDVTVALPDGKATFLHGPFNTVPMHASEWVMAMALGVGVFLTETLRKLIAPRLFSLGKWKPVHGIARTQWRSLPD